MRHCKGLYVIFRRQKSVSKDPGPLVVITACEKASITEARTLDISSAGNGVMSARQRALSKFH
jgi:hypothetical protein